MTRLLIICLIILTISKSSFGQNNFRLFVKDLKELQLPFVIDDKLLPDTLLVSRQEAWDYLILPVTRLNELKEEMSQFPIDTTLILLYKQWDNIDLQKKERISIYSPTFNGRLYCSGTFKINKEVNGIIWAYYQEDILYGHGPIHYLFTYDKYGKLLDFIPINSNQNFSSGLENSRICERTEIENNTVKITSINTNRTTIRITDEGQFEKLNK